MSDKSLLPPLGEGYRPDLITNVDQQQRDKWRKKWASMDEEDCNRSHYKHYEWELRKTLDELEVRERQIIQLAKSTSEAKDLIGQFGGIDGSHHKMWVIDQVVRKLVGDGYADWVKTQKDGEDGPDTYDWDEGIAP